MQAARSIFLDFIDCGCADSRSPAAIDVTAHQVKISFESFRLVEGLAVLEHSLTSILYGCTFASDSSSESSHQLEMKAPSKALQPTQLLLHFENAALPRAAHR